MMWSVMTARRGLRCSMIDPATRYTTFTVPDLLYAVDPKLASIPCNRRVQLTCASTTSVVLERIVVVPAMPGRNPVCFRNDLLPVL